MAGTSSGTYTVAAVVGVGGGQREHVDGAGALTWGSTYYWQVAVSDAASPPGLSSTSVTWTTPISFVVGSAQAASTAGWGRWCRPMTGTR